MNQGLKEKQKIRFQFLNILYEMSDGNTDKLISGEDVAKEIGLLENSEKSISAVNYLKGKYLIEDANIMAGPLGILKITHSGVIEVESAISKPELPTQFFPPINILHVNQMIGSTIQQGTVNSSQNIHMSMDSISELQNFIEKLNGSINQLPLNDSDRKELNADISTLESQIKSPKPKSNIINEGLKSVRIILESCMGSALGSQLAGQIPTLFVLFRFYLKALFQPFLAGTYRAFQTSI